MNKKMIELLIRVVLEMDNDFCECDNTHEQNDTTCRACLAVSTAKKLKGATETFEQEKLIYSPNRLQIMYLDWRNNFLTIPRFAEYYRISIALAHQIRFQGFILHEATVAIQKEAEK